MKNKANVNATDAYGNTPTHYASQYGNGETLAYLLRFNPKLYIKNRERKTPIDVAQNPEIIDIFGKYVNSLKQKVQPGSKKRKNYRKETIKKKKRPMSPNKKLKNSDRRLSNDFSKVGKTLDSREKKTGFETDRGAYNILHTHRSRNPQLLKASTSAKSKRMTTKEPDSSKLMRDRPYATMGDEPQMEEEDDSFTESEEIKLKSEAFKQ